MDKLDNGLYYSDQDILSLFKESANKKEQVKILADMNMCGIDDIRAACIRAGLDGRCFPRSLKPYSAAKKPRKPRTRKTDSNKETTKANASDTDIHLQNITLSETEKEYIKTASEYYLYNNINDKKANLEIQLEEYSNWINELKLKMDGYMSEKEKVEKELESLNKLIEIANIISNLK